MKCYDPGVPIEIRESLERFRQDHPDELKTSFLMMRFGNTPAHAAIVKGISEVLSLKGISVLRADGKQYHDDLFPNVLTYIYGSRFGIAVFERLEDDDFNPNVSLEVGYLFALRKPVCLLKSQVRSIRMNSFFTQSRQAFIDKVRFDLIEHRGNMERLLWLKRF
jgi:hypothetical protein